MKYDVAKDLQDIVASAIKSGLEGKSPDKVEIRMTRALFVFVATGTKIKNDRFVLFGFDVEFVSSDSMFVDEYVFEIAEKVKL